MTNRIKRKEIFSINIYRVFFTTVILLHHFRMYSDQLPYGGGYMATDFFFIMSGFLLYKTYEREEFHSIGKYIYKRYIRLSVPLILCNFILFFTSKIFIEYRLPNNFAWFLKENLMIELFSCNSSERFNPPCWYLGMLLLASLIVYFILKVTENVKNKSLIRNLVFLSTTLIYIVLVYINGNGNIYIQHKVLFDAKTFLRALSGVSLGAIFGNIKMIIPSKIRAFVLGLLTLWLGWFLLWEDGYSRSDILVYLLLVFSTYLICEEKKDYSNFISNAFSSLARASYVAFIIHYPLVRILAFYKIFGQLDWKIYSAMYLIIVWGCALIFDKLIFLFNIAVKRIKYNLIQKGEI